MQHGDASACWGLLFFFLFFLAFLNGESNIFNEYSRIPKLTFLIPAPSVCQGRENGTSRVSGSQSCNRVVFSCLLLSVHRHMRTLLLSSHTKYLSS